MEKISQITKVKVTRDDFSITVKATGKVTSPEWKNPVLTEESRLSGELILCFQADKPAIEQGPPPITIEAKRDFNSDGIEKVTVKAKGSQKITVSVPD